MPPSTGWTTSARTPDHGRSLVGIPSTPRITGAFSFGWWPTSFAARQVASAGAKVGAWQADAGGHSGACLGFPGGWVVEEGLLGLICFSRTPSAETSPAATGAEIAITPLLTTLGIPCGAA
jgi:hypothetical protein